MVPKLGADIFFSSEAVKNSFELYLNLKEQYKTAANMQDSQIDRHKIAAIVAFAVSHTSPIQKKKMHQH